MRVSLIATVLNEGDAIGRLMESLIEQSRQADEIVIVDGGSRDGTVNAIRSYSDRLPVQVIVEPGANISRGRNIAIAAATGDIIAATDAGVRLTRDWLKELIAPFETDPDLTGVAGFFLPDPHTTFEAAMGATVLPQRDEIDPATFLPSSRSVAFKKSAWKDAGGYPEWLDYCEDLIFDLRVKALAGSFAFAPDALVYFRPRGSLRSFYKQYYLYARGDGKADLWRKRHMIRYGTYLIGVPGIAIAGAALYPALWLLYGVGGVVYCKRPFQRLPAVMATAPDRSVSAWIKAALWVPVIRIVGDFAKMAGYPVGLRWRRVNNPPDWNVG
jgi:glycosyltransferase involved in cell wall biosynthesis